MNEALYTGLLLLSPPHLQQQQFIGECEGAQLAVKAVHQVRCARTVKPAEVSCEMEEAAHLLNLYSPNIVLRSPFYFALVQIKGANERGYSHHLYLTYPVSHPRLHLQREASLQGTRGQQIRDPSLTHPTKDPVQSAASCNRCFSSIWWIPQNGLGDHFQSKWRFCTDHSCSTGGMLPLGSWHREALRMHGFPSSLQE